VVKLVKKEIIIIEEDKEGGYFAISNKYTGAIGQGETPEQALKDLEKAVEVLKEYLEKKKKGEKLSLKKENRLINNIARYMIKTGARAKGRRKSR